MHGYDMARYFREDLSEVCPLEQSLLYSYIRNLEKRGLIDWTEERVGLRPPRKVYRLTQLGAEHARNWLKIPVQRLREVRTDFLVKLYVLHELDRKAEQILLAEQIEVCEVYRTELVDRAASLKGFDALVARSKLSAADATLRWLRDYAWETEGLV